MVTTMEIKQQRRSLFTTLQIFVWERNIFEEKILRRKILHLFEGSELLADYCGKL